MKQIGSYQVLEEIARGGAGAVYKARDTVMDRVVAIKVLHGGGSELARKRFRREAQALAKLEHPHVVQVFDYDFTERGEPYMVMEFVEGESLQRRLDRGGPLPWREVVELAQPLCLAVQACHEAGVLHRDLKPANVLVGSDGRIRLADFGLVRDADPSTSYSRLSLSGALLGTPGFWAPEQANGQLDAIDERVDVYGLGSVLYALLTGVPPHQGSTLADVLADLDKPRTKPSHWTRDVPGWLDTTVLRCLAADPNARFPSAAAFALSLSGGADSSSSSRATHAAIALCVSGALAATLIAVWPLTKSTASTKSTGSTQVPPASPDGVSSQTPFEIALARGDEAYAAKDYGDALAAYAEAIELDPIRGEAWYGHGSARSHLGDLAGALADLHRAVGLSPDDARAHRNLGIVRSQLEDWSGSLEASAAAIRLNPRLTRPYETRAIALARLGDFHAALQDLDRALEHSPQRAGLYFQRGTVRAQTGDFARALEDLDQAIRMETERPLFFKARAQIHAELEHFLESLQDYEVSSQAGLATKSEVRAVQDAWFARGNARRRQGDPQGAVEDFTGLLRFSQDVRYIHRRGMAWADLGEHVNAIADFDETIRLHPRAVGAFCERGICKVKLGDHAGGLADTLEAAKLSPDDPRVLINLVAIRIEMGDLNGARVDADRFVEMHPDSSASYRSRAQVRSAQGDERGAIEDYDHSLRIEAGNTSALAGRGILHRDLGNYRAAVADMERAIELGHPEAKAMLPDLIRMRDLIEKEEFGPR